MGIILASLKAKFRKRFRFSSVMTAFGITRGDMLKCVIICYFGASACGALSAAAQSPLPPAGSGQRIEGGVGLPAAPPAVSLGGTRPKVHTGPTGKPCVEVRGNANPQASNTHIFEHTITATNSCSQVVKLSVCYRGSDRCIPMTVSSYSRQTSVLGIEPAMTAFRFEYWERFP